MTIRIDRTTDNGDGTLTVYAVTPGYHQCHVIVGRDKVADGTVYALLELAASKVDSRAQALATQQMHDEKGGSDDDTGV